MRPVGDGDGGSARVRSPRSLLIAAWAWLAAGCASDVPDRWHYVYETIIAPSCTTSACHSQLSMAGRLELYDDTTAYEALTGRACGDEAATVAGYVDVTDPSRSLLSGLLRRSGPTGMPPNGRLATIEIERIEAWMRRGAPCD
jgi:hypothetical protein